MLNTHALPRPVALLAGVLASVLLVFGLGAPSADAANHTVLSNEFGKAKSHIEGTFGNHGVVVGTFTPRRFVSNGSTMDAVGVLKATLIRGSGKVVGTDKSRQRIPVEMIEGQPVGATTRAAALAPSCDILNLVLGPLDLDLL